MKSNQLATPLIFVELNEVNFDIAKMYIRQGILDLPNFKRMLKGHFIRTSCEKKYHLLEPWIQWVSVHTGLSFKKHNIFRLGDIVGSRLRQIFEKLEVHKYSIGAISPMNAENNMVSPKYFIPDPWTKSTTDGSFWSKALTNSITQAVNDNSQSKIDLKSLAILFVALLKFSKIKHYPIYFKLALTSRNAPWRKALFLDLFLHDIHLYLFKKNKNDFSVLFLNAGAHIQHHYFFNAKPLKNISKLRNPSWYIKENIDPVAEYLSLYDLILGEYLKIQSELIVATGLSQRPYDQIKCYYRLKDHKNFLSLIGVVFKEVFPRMTRDFLITFNTKNEALKAKDLLKSIKTVKEHIPLFKQIDNRGKDLFVTLTYPYEIYKECKIYSLNKKEIPLLDHVAFVAIKNGMHQEEGFAFFTDKVSKFSPKNKAHVKTIHNSILNYFGVTF
jgi:hypothetical protein